MAEDFITNEHGPDLRNDLTTANADGMTYWIEKDLPAVWYRVQLCTDGRLLRVRSDNINAEPETLTVNWHTERIKQFAPIFFCIDESLAEPYFTPHFWSKTSP